MASRPGNDDDSLIYAPPRIPIAQLASAANRNYADELHSSETLKLLLNARKTQLSIIQNERHTTLNYVPQACGILDAKSGCCTHYSKIDFTEGNGKREVDTSVERCGLLPISLPRMQETVMTRPRRVLPEHVANYLLTRSNPMYSIVGERNPFPNLLSLREKVPGAAVLGTQSFDLVVDVYAAMLDGIVSHAVGLLSVSDSTVLDAQLAQVVLDNYIE